MIRISKLAYLGDFLLLLCIAFPVIGSPVAFGWLLLIPVAVAVWVARSRTVVGDDGLEAHSLFASRTVAWADVEGIRFPNRGWARACLADGSEVVLPAVGSDRIRELAAASGGRIPDPYLTPTNAAADSESANAAE